MNTKETSQKDCGCKGNTTGKSPDEKAIESFQESAASRETAIRHVIARSSKAALAKMPSPDKIQRHWNNSARTLLTQLRRQMEAGAGAESENWSLARSQQFVLFFDGIMGALDVGWDNGLRDATGVVYQRRANDTPGDGCGDAPNYPEGASCSLRCSMERDWMLCRVGCGVTEDCSWPCFACVEANITHAACVADCIFSVTPPRPDQLNPASFSAVVARS